MALIWSEGFCLGPLNFILPAGEKKKQVKNIQKYLCFQLVSSQSIFHVQCCKVCHDGLQSSQPQLATSSCTRPGAPLFEAAEGGIGINRYKRRIVFIYKTLVAKAWSSFKISSCHENETVFWKFFIKQTSKAWLQFSNTCHIN